MASRRVIFRIFFMDPLPQVVAAQCRPARTSCQPNQICRNLQGPTPSHPQAHRTIAVLKRLPQLLAGPAVRPKHKSRRTCWLELHSVSSASNAIKSTEHSKISGLGEKRAGKTASQLGLKLLGLRPLSATTLSGSTSANLR